MLDSTLKELIADDLIKRKEYDQLPLKVEYSLTESGKSLIPLLDGLCAWGDNHKLYFFSLNLRSLRTGGAVNQPPERGYKHVEDDVLCNLDSLAANKYGLLSSAKL